MSTWLGWDAQIAGETWLLGMTVRVFPEEISVWMGRLSKEDRPHQCEGASPQSIEAPVEQEDRGRVNYSKSPTYVPSSCALSKMWTCVRMSNHVSYFTCLVYIVTCVHPLQVVVLLCTLLQYCGEYSSTVSLFLACSLDASPCTTAVVLDYCTFQGTVL